MKRLLSIIIALTWSVSSFASFDYTPVENCYCSSNLPPAYLPLHCHAIDSVSAIGDSFTIEDGSAWSVPYEMGYTLLSWRTTDPITITPNNNWVFYKDYQYKIINLQTGEAVYANLYLGPILQNLNTHTIVMMDYYRQEVMLENNTVWRISTNDMRVFSEWMVKDHIMIGSNQDEWLSAEDFILINSETNSYVRVSQVR